MGQNREANYFPGAGWWASPWQCPDRGVGHYKCSTELGFTREIQGPRAGPMLDPIDQSDFSLLVWLLYFPYGKYKNIFASRSYSKQRVLPSSFSPDRSHSTDTAVIWPWSLVGKMSDLSYPSGFLLIFLTLSALGSPADLPKCCRCLTPTQRGRTESAPHTRSQSTRHGLPGSRWLEPPLLSFPSLSLRSMLGGRDYVDRMSRSYLVTAMASISSV